MSEGERPRLRLIPGGRDSLKLGRIAVEVAPRYEAPTDAVVLEEDTWMILTAPPEIREPEVHPVRLFTELMHAEPLATGTVAVRNGKPPRLLAVVHDLNRSPSCDPAWVGSALAGIFAIAADRRFRSLEIPLLGVRHGGLPLPVFVDLLREAAEKGAPGYPERLFLPVPEEIAGEVRALLRRAREKCL